MVAHEPRGKVISYFRVVSLSVACDYAPAASLLNLLVPI